ncbi:P-loop containing nucleoside triphosphate hydrolase protein [Chytriomyces cf. hyalinus JEL632]|nr:P-loop containing nucleoside triphosphate hydrolase protein [Chytriomyces cf. hyalinus JEL632]
MAPTSDIHMGDAPAASADSKLKKGVESPEETARWYHFIVASWLTGFVKMAARTPLQFDDLFKLHPVFSAKSSSERIGSAFEKHLDVALKKLDAAGLDRDEKIGKALLTRRENAFKWSLLNAILTAERRKIFMALALHVQHLIAQFLAPLILSALLKAEPYSGVAYGMVAALFCTQMAQALGWNNSQYIARGASMSVKAALVSMVYKKAFRLGTKGRAQYPTGVIMNLVASDCSVIEMSLQFLTDVFCLPWEIVTLSILILVFAGGAGAAGLSFMIICTGLSLGISSYSIGFERKALAATDERVKVTSEVINGIKIVKFFAWETPFFERLTLLRDQELAQHFKLRMINATFSAIMNILPSFTNVIVFSVYRSLGNSVDAATVFATLSVINLIKLPIAVAPFISQSMFSSLVSLERLAKFLAAEEMEQDQIDANATNAAAMDEKTAILLKNASFMWASSESEQDAEKSAADDFKISDRIDSTETVVTEATELSPQNSRFTLKDINLDVRKGSLTMIVGKVGSGKSSLLSAFIGDMIPTAGDIAISSQFGYSPQASWLQNTTLRANVLFGSAFDEKRYNETIRCCGLSKDLTILPFGDMSDIGEKGITLSGGQAARVNLARAVYSNAEILLLDDPLAAVDSHVGKQILDECILGVLKEKTVILVTHQLHIAPQADQIVVMDQGVISEQGSFQELMQSRGGFYDLMQEYGHSDADEDAEDAITGKVAKTDADDLKESDKKGVDINEQEERQVGSVALKFYLFYFKNAGPIAYIVMLLIMYTVWQATRLFSDLWLTFWVEDRFGKIDGFYMIGLLILATVQGLLIGIATIAFARACITAGRNIHRRALDSLLHVPMVFFETNPTGRIISRFSKDFSDTDRQLPRLFQSVLETILGVLGTFVLIIYASPWMVIVIAAIIPVYLYFLKLYRASMRELKRIESIARSPLYAQIGETFAGLSTIRAFGVADAFILSQEKLQDTANRPTYILSCLDVWVALRAESFVAFLIGMMALFGVALNVNRALLGLALSYALTMMFQLNFGLRNLAAVEALMNSVERLSHYITDLKPEGSGKRQLVQSQPPKNWPQAGSLEFKNLTLKYRPELQPILHSLSFKIEPGTKVGVVGRTGAGKSSIITALFRLVEYDEGTIEVDGVNVASLDLTVLRSSLAIIPQAPVLFDGTIRSNLDPFSNKSDDDLWTVLERCSLREYVANLPAKLDAAVAEGGSNLSVGQRQLLCLGRAMLVKSKVLLIDEATASVDMETDSYIQKVLREDFAECTVLCIAHRLNTLMDYDKILVLDAGRLAEYDTPHNLAVSPASLFSSLIDETGASNAALLRKIAFTKSVN